MKDLRSPRRNISKSCISAKKVRGKGGGREKEEEGEGAYESVLFF